MADVDEIEEVYGLFRLSDEQLGEVGVTRGKLVEDYRKYHAVRSAYKALKQAELALHELRTMTDEDRAASSVTLVPYIDKALERENRIKRRMCKLRLLSKLVGTVQALKAECDLCEYLAQKFEEFAPMWTAADAQSFKTDLDIKRKFGAVIDKFDQLFHGDEGQQLNTIYILEEAVSEFTARRNLILEQIDTKLNNEFFNY